MGLLAAQIVSMFGLGLVSWVIGVLPIFGVKRGWFKVSEVQSPLRQLFYSLLLCFGGGVILTSCLTHMLPDVREIYLIASSTGAFPNSGMDVPEILVLAGFLMIYMIEEVAHGILEHFGIISSHHDDHELEHEKHDKEKEGAGGGHGHSHEFNASSDTIQDAARGFLVILALCIHDLFEGIALGVSRKESAVWFLLLAFASHKWVIAGCLGMKWSSSALKPLVSVLYMTTFCVVSPIGIIVGMLLTSPGQESNMMNGTLIILQGIATGSLMYVVFFEILEKERQKPVSGILQALAFSGGYIFMVLLGLAEVQSSAEEVGLNATESAMVNLTSAFL
ncbi:zinc transporter ZIP1 [Eurytemora carolleeae]|uniref:zinc transporter ZIP1 n=1 Tax=Eurytemora carolleeae TaxID=1294199 RepID=UPI000C7915F1|nr:zinc transporter ZIP1 [Eurytemora carolleeae]|eukprot:XP_023347914.1 zinc transporter ZIP1-like [Eurytemora affinis]